MASIAAASADELASSLQHDLNCLMDPNRATRYITFLFD